MRSLVEECLTQGSGGYWKLLMSCPAVRSFDFQSTLDRPFFSALGEWEAPLYDEDGGEVFVRGEGGGEIPA